MTMSMSRSRWRTGLPSPAGPKSPSSADHGADPDAVVERLLPFDVICVMRERTPLPREVIERLPQLKLIASTGRRNASIDMEAAEVRGMRATATGYRSTPPIRVAVALLR